MALERYRQKRHFRKTPEPAGVVPGKGAKAATEVRAFVIQKHAASHLHYDFRLELGGVLKSWAVPKGPSLDPKVRRLAIEVEDHPLAYGGFEGTIPEGQYGGGTVMLWDRGTWEPLDQPRAAYEKGALHFILRGEKLRGEWILVRSGTVRGEKAQWFLIKKRDRYAASAADQDILAKDLSVSSGLSMEEIAAGDSPIWQSNRAESNNAAALKPKQKSRSKIKAIEGASKAPFPKVVLPQLATLVAHAPAGEDWIHEIKFDGYRILASLEKGEVRLSTRRGNDWSSKYQGIAKELSKCSQSCVLDGEIIAEDTSGRSSFQSLQAGAGSALLYQVFDLLYLNGFDLRGVSQRRRKELLKDLLDKEALNAKVIRYTDHIEGRGEPFFKKACALKLEGTIAKRADAPYHEGRSRSWLKIKCSAGQELVIGGYRLVKGAHQEIGALLLGYFEDEKFRYAGKVGTGFTSAMRRELLKRMHAIRTEECPFAEMSRAEKRGASWVSPVLVCEISFTEWTNDRHLRHPSFKGLRADKRAADVSFEKPSAAQEAPRKAKMTAAVSKVLGVSLSHPHRPILEECSLTKQALAHYYEQIGELMLEYVADRPLTLVRCPEGQKAHCFFQKHAKDTMPRSLPRTVIEEDRGPAEYIYVHKVSHLIELVQLNVLEIHCSGARRDKPAHPDIMVMDFDPDPTVSFDRVAAAARRLREILIEVDLASFVRTSGGKGIHVVVPFQRRYSWDEVKAFAQSLALTLEKEAPERFTTVMSKSKRSGKIFIDYLRNTSGATAISSYSIRARHGAPVALPLSWEELETVDRASYFDTEAVLDRVKKQSRVWKEFSAARRQKLPLPRRK